MTRKIGLLVTFYRSFFITTFIITCGCVIIYGFYGIKTFTFLFWFKIITLGMIYFVIETSKNKEFYYYQNLGVSKRLLWSATLIFDLLLFIFLIILIHRIR